MSGGVVAYVRNNHLALLALVVAVIGVPTAWAVARNTVGSKQIKKAGVKRSDIASNAVTSVKVADGSLLASDFVTGQLPAGIQGEPGPAGRSALTPLQSGETVRGVIGHDDHATAGGQGFGAVATLPIPAPEVLDDAKVLVDGSDDPDLRCTGSFLTPTTDPGFVCIYASVTQADSVTGRAAGLNLGGVQFGFSVTWDSTAVGNTFVYGTWAYTAP